MATGKLAVNLIPKEKAKKRTWGKFLNWVLTYGRYIIIGTEIVLLIILLFRFKLDRNLGNLSEELKEKQTKIESFGNLEEQTLSLQAHLAAIKRIETQSKSPTQTLSSLSSLTPSDVIFTKLEINQSDVNLSATAFSLEGFALFIESLKRSNDFRNISLEKIEEDSSGIDFTISFAY